MYYIKIYFQSKKDHQTCLQEEFSQQRVLSPDASSLCQVRTISLLNTWTKVSQNTCYRLFISYMLKVKHNEC